MQPELFIALCAGLGGMIGWGLADFFAKKTIDRIGDIASLAWGHIFGTLALFVGILYRKIAYGHGFGLPHGAMAWSLLLLFGVGQAAVYYFVYKGFGKGQISILNPIFASFSGLTALLSIIVFKEAVSGYVLAGLGILFIGVMLISADLQALRARRFSFAHIPGFNEVVIATVLAALWTLFWDKLLGGQDWLSYTFVMYFFMTATILAVCAFQKTELLRVDRPLWKFLVGIGLGETIAYGAVSIGYSATSYTSTVAVLSGAFSLPVIVLARIFLKEKITRMQMVGGLVIVLGIMCLAIS